MTKCPQCGYKWPTKRCSAHLAAITLGSIKTRQKAVSSRQNGRLGGRPKKPKKEKEMFVVVEGLIEKGGLFYHK